MGQPLLTANDTFFIRVRFEVPPFPVYSFRLLPLSTPSLQSTLPYFHFALSVHAYASARFGNPPTGAH